MAKGLGAKKKLGLMQGRGLDECAICHEDDCGLSPCGSCGDLLCKDCKMDHDCVTPEPAPSSKRNQR
jgi:hypothetical protein